MEPTQLKIETRPPRWPEVDRRLRRSWPRPDVERRRPLKLAPAPWPQGEFRVDPER